MGLTSPHLEAFAVARGSAKNIFEVIDRQPVIDPLGEAGLKMSDLKGKIEFRDIHFEYPSRRDVKVSLTWFLFI